jgi:2,3-diaminopropionate biosynthesis protein SbnB
VRVIGYRDIASILSGRESVIIELVRSAYICHEFGRTAVPHSTFLRFPGNVTDRIIALPAFLDGDPPVAGVKWVSSFPGNHELGFDRASAVIVLNSSNTGRPIAVLEGSIISAKRTAASAALAASVLAPLDALTTAGLVGCGVINKEVVRFLAAVWPTLSKLIVTDVVPDRAARLAAAVSKLLPGVQVSTVAFAGEVLGEAEISCIATTAQGPHLDLSECAPGSLVLHLSLRDVTPEAILAAHNVVDDPDHVCREGTSLQLAADQVGDRRFIAATIGQMLVGSADQRRDSGKVTVFSPFGLGALDLALAGHVRTAAIRTGAGLSIDDFLPDPPSAADVGA